MAAPHPLFPKNGPVGRLLRAGLGGVFGCVLSTAGTLPATAAPPAVPLPTAPESFATGLPATGPFGFLSNLSRTNYLLGDMWGLRTLLSR
ncbi:MAG: hypothetical protein ACREE1_07090, partial [Stellaceae bacterium]